MRHVAIFGIFVFLTSCSLDYGLSDGSDLINVWDSREKGDSYSFYNSTNGKYYPIWNSERELYDFNWSVRLGVNYNVADIDFTYETLPIVGSRESGKESIRIEYYFTNNKQILWIKVVGVDEKFFEYRRRESGYYIPI